MNTKNTLQPNTHLEASEKFVGKIISLENGISKVTLIITSEMVVDKFGLAHGSFAFGLADYAAMLAINEPTVVLGKAEVKFIKPVILNDEVTAIASLAQPARICFFGFRKTSIFPSTDKCAILSEPIS